MSAAMNTGSFAKYLMPGVKAWFGMNYNQYSPQYTEIFNTERSMKAFEEHTNMNGFGHAKVMNQGENVEYDDADQTFTKQYVHVTYGLGFILTRNAMDDGQYLPLAQQYSKKLAQSMHQTKETIAANVLNRGFNSSYTGVDGIELFASNHVLTKGGTYRNELAVAADFSEASLEQACIDIQAFKDDASLTMAAKPQKLILPPALQFEARRVLGSALQNDTANNALNALKDQGVLQQGVCINQYLTDADAWFIKTDVMHGLTHMQRRDAAMSNDLDFDSENVKFKCTERYDFGWTDARGVFGSAGA